MVLSEIVEIYSYHVLGRRLSGIYEVDNRFKTLGRGIESQRISVSEPQINVGPYLTLGYVRRNFRRLSRSFSSYSVIDCGASLNFSLLNDLLGLAQRLIHNIELPVDRISLFSRIINVGARGDKQQQVEGKGQPYGDWFAKYELWGDGFASLRRVYMYKTGKVLQSCYRKRTMSAASRNRTRTG